jgi:hypothetical protein
MVMLESSDFIFIYSIRLHFLRVVKVEFVAIIIIIKEQSLIKNFLNFKIISFIESNRVMATFVRPK